ncbi:hypothetical protein BESB_045510 [Besnoitia besnoiti]|uniref:Transporter n=1 Tax=Besnoitia besnoiti TaxID=94643 RepID=A0A2A9MEQ8_BESBE|nr:hypothetical protein BESB_045510 [Besnoitia besnoiti]PFH36359.1 hypothetical protein BESB_045510 [Besnoitia besnoiti]
MEAVSAAPAAAAPEVPAAEPAPAQSEDAAPPAPVAAGEEGSTVASPLADTGQKEESVSSPPSAAHAPAALEVSGLSAASNRETSGLGTQEAPAHGSGGVLGFLASLLPRSDLPGARQKTPFGLNRYVLLLVYSVVVFTTGAVFYGWTALSGMIFRNDGLAHLCPKNASGEYEPDMRKQGQLFICDEQDAAVQKLYTMTFAVACVMSACAGTLLDWLGPLFTEILGQTFNLVGWLLLAFSSPDFPAYYISLVFIGLGADSSLLPTLCVRRLFPGSTGLIITIIGSAASASFGIPLILNSIVENHGASVRTVSLCYCCVGPVLGILIAIFLIPRSGFALDDAGTTFREEEEMLITEEEEARHGIVPEPAPGGFEDGCVGRGGGERESKREKAKRKANRLARDVVGSSFWKQLLSIRYCLIVVYFVVVSWGTSYYQQAARRMFSDAVISVLEVLLPLSFIPCIILGKIADMVGIFKVLFVINSAGLLTYVFSFFDSDGTGYASALCFMIYMSLLTSQMFVYIEATFSPNHFGKLIGIGTMVGGLLSLVSNCLYEDVTVNREGGNPRSIQIAMTALLCVQYVWIATLAILHVKNPKPYAPRQVEPSSDASKKAEEGEVLV